MLLELASLKLASSLKVVMARRTGGAWCRWRSKLRQASSTCIRRMCACLQRSKCVLSTAANLQVVHRDIALRNILLDGTSRVRVCDFGMARQHAAGAEKDSETQNALGPVCWMSPEAFRRKFSFKSDVYALCRCFGRSELRCCFTGTALVCCCGKCARGSGHGVTWTLSQ